MSVKVKICGITNVADAIAAVEAGADALGFIFYEKSPRFVSLEQAVAVVDALPPFVSRVGVFVNAEEEYLRRAVEVCRLDRLQFHGSESPADVRRLGLGMIKAFRIAGRESIANLADYQHETWLLDSYVADQLGGTGLRLDWALAAEICRGERPVILAGGLTPGNAAEAVRTVRPYALDVSSGVEKAPGRKDHDKVRAFIAAAKAVPD